MNPELASKRRMLLMAHAKFLSAERAWIEAQRDVKTWFPKQSKPSVVTIGNPGSTIRRLHDQRDRAVLQLEGAHVELKVAKRRLEQKTQMMANTTVWLLSARFL